MRNPRLSLLLLLMLQFVQTASAQVGVAAASPQNSGSPQAQSDTYVIGPGDSLRIFVLGNPDLSTEVLVRPDGQISAPLVKDIPAVGKTPAKLAQEIEIALAEYVRSPTVNVIVSNPTSTYSQVRVVGQAANPKALAYRSGMTVLDVVIEVGGLSQFAAGNRAVIIRTGENGKPQRIKVRLADLTEKGAIENNVQMRAGDVLLIPEARF